MIRDSVHILHKGCEATAQILGLQWADLHAACVEARNSTTSSAIEKRILVDLVEYLSKRNLEYFTGFQRLTSLPEFTVVALFPSEDQTIFRLIPLPDISHIRRLLA